MKKILFIITTIIAGAFLITSCNINSYPTFDDTDAYISFNSATISVNENAGTVRVPVSLVSLKGVTSTASFEVVNGTAKSGVNFTLSGSTSLDFSSGSTQYIEIKVIDLPGDFTGDLAFTLNINNAGSVNVGAENSCTVRILDLDHPLTFILGNYSITAEDAWGDGPETWNMSIAKDANDVTMVWILGLSKDYQAGIAVYGTVNEDKTILTVPSHQRAYNSTSYGNQFLCGARVVDKVWSMFSSSDRIFIYIDSNGNLSMDQNIQMGVHVWNTAGAALGWFERWAEYSFTKK